MSESNHERALVETQAALEAEYGHLHDQSGAEFRLTGTLEERQQKLRNLIHRLNDEKPKTEGWALSLSGGGIRSATFSLGVLQGLAKRDLLGRFTYLSTVSGGGYIGGWLSRWIQQAKGDVDAIQSALKGGTGGSAASEPPQVSWLRAYSNYLSPVWGLSSDFFTLISIVLRNLLLNWCVLLPLIAAALLVPYLYVGLLELPKPCIWVAVTMILIAAVCLIVGIGYVVADLPDEDVPDPPPRNQFVACCFVPIVAAAILLGVTLRWVVPQLPEAGWMRLPIWVWFVITGAAVHLLGYGVGLAWRRERVSGASSAGASDLQRANSRWADLRDMLFVVASGAIGGGMLCLLFRVLPEKVPAFRDALLFATAAVPAMLATFWLATTVYVALIRAWSSEGEREWWARSGGWWIRASLFWAVGFALVIYAPQWVLDIPGFAGTSTQTLMTGGGLWGLATGLIGYWSKNRAEIADRARGFASIMGARLLDLAAIAFILALLLAICLSLSWGLAQWRDATPAAPHTFDRSLKPISIQTVEAVALSTESAARTTESVTRAVMEEKRLAGAAPTASSELVANTAHATGSAAQRLQMAAAAVRGSASETRRGAEIAAKAAQTVTAAAALISATDVEARNAMIEALGSATAATANLASRSESLALWEQTGPSARYATEIAAVGVPALLLFIALLVAGIFFSAIVGINTFSLHSMYGNRLVRAYFGAARAGEKRKPHWFTGFDNRDNVSMSQLRMDGCPLEKRRLFHVVNLALNLVSPSGDRLEWQQRKAASFTVTPLHSGSAAVGYVPSKEYAGPAGQGISLARAMTISGAAASPNMGYHSSPAVAFVMTLFNVRLGWWLPNPAPVGKAVWHRGEPGVRSLPLLLAEALGLTTANRPYVYLSDGGHFENLGLYEMVRRRCRRILVVDASADPDFGYGDLQDAIRKIRIDLGIFIEFPKASFDAPLRYTVGTIRYGDVDQGASDGLLCYLKPALFGDEPLDVQRYAAASRERDGAEPFPHQTTADQFFDEAQFESYRMLGYYMVENLLNAGGGWPTQSAPRERRAQQTVSIPTPALGGGSTSGGDRAGEGSLSKIVSSVQNMSQGAILASAITVGGVLGVSGTVALKDSTVTVKPGAEINISQNSLDELKAMKLQVEQPPMSDGGGAGQDLKPLTDQVLQISANLKSASGSQQASAEAAQRLVALVDTLEKRLKMLETSRVQSPPLPTASIDALKDAVSTLAGEVKTASAALKGGVEARGVLRALEEVDRKLGDIRGSVQEVPPRRNIRGVEGGGR